MEIREHITQNGKIAELSSTTLIFSNLEDTLQIMGDLYYQGYDSIIIYKSAITPAFFDLKTKLAGEILQKFSNYRMRLGIIGEWSDVSSKSLSDFITESNTGRLIYFGTTVEETLVQWGS